MHRTLRTFPARSPRRLGSRRAMTLLEVVLAVLLLSLTVAAVMGAISSIATMEGNGRKRLEAYEVANRILLQFLDDAKALPSKSEPITYGNNEYMWELTKSQARMLINRKQESGTPNLQALDRFVLVGVVVYEVRHVGLQSVKGDPIALLSRLVDPAAPRNPDSIQLYKDPDRIGDLINSIVNGSGATGGGDLQGRMFK